MQYNDLMSLWKQFQGLEKGVPQSHYTRKVINFGESRNQGDFVIRVYGDYINKSNYTGDVGDATIRISSRSAAEIPITEFKKSKGVFNNIYIKSTDTTGYFIFYVGGAWSGEIETAAGDKVGLLTSSGVSINPVRDERHQAHTGKHLKATLTDFDTAQQLTATSTKVKWAIISSKDYAFRWGFTNTVKQSTAIGLYVGSGGSVAVEYCDLSEIYFVDGDGINKPVLQVEYIEEAT